MKKSFVLGTFVFVITILIEPIAYGAIGPSETQILVKPNSQLDFYLNDVAFYEYQLGAVMIDMNLYIGWDFENKEEMKKVSELSLKRIDCIIADLINLKTPPEALDLKQVLISAAERLQNIFRNIHTKNRAEIIEELNGLRKNYVVYQRKMEERFKLSEVINPDQELPYPNFKDKKLKKRYDIALELYKGKQYVKAYDILKTLKEELNEGSTEYDFVVFYICESLGKSWFFGEPITTDKNEGIIQYSEDIFKKEYSPLFSYFFVRWRTNKQAMEYGVSNWSQIANWEYNLKRKELLDKLKKYAQNNPKDKWVRVQIGQLMNFDNIERGGPRGNYTLNYLGVLYMDL